jgi:hypothetical protein
MQLRLFLSSPLDRRAFLMIVEELQFRWLKEKNLKKKNNLWYCVIVFFFFWDNFKAYMIVFKN